MSRVHEFCDPVEFVTLNPVKCPEKHSELFQIY